MARILGHDSEGGTAYLLIRAIRVIRGSKIGFLKNLNATALQLSDRITAQ
jgi:hypothetical protein